MRKPRLVSLVCVNCSITFTRNAHWVQNPEKTVCTRYCNGTVPTPLGPSTKIAILTCSNPKCGTLFVRKAKDIRRDLDHTFCSKRCSGRPPGNSAGVKIAYFNCEACGKLFVRRAKQITKDAAHVVCSNTCRDDLRRIRPTHMPCETCGNLIPVTTRDYYNIVHHYCSPDCVPASPRHDITIQRFRFYTVKRCDFTKAQWEMLTAVFQHRCAYCGKKPPRLTKDHLTPLSKGGEHTLSNIVPACKSCNSRKQAGNVLKPVQPLLL